MWQDSPSMKVLPRLVQPIGRKPTSNSGFPSTIRSVSGRRSPGESEKKLVGFPFPQGTIFLMSLSPSLTSATLLGRLRCSPADQEAWKEFVLRYGPKIYRWCRQWNLQEADAQDVAQTVLLKLAGKMPAFDYDPSR